jgi:glyoxylase-like metal-dependent hydrolase (beta-lactamase superfamily II)
MAGRYGTVVRIVISGDTVPMGGHGDGPWPATVADDAVYQVWRSVTGRELSPAAGKEFAARAAALSLAEVGGPG